VRNNSGREVLENETFMGTVGARDSVENEVISSEVITGVTMGWWVVRRQETGDQGYPVSVVQLA
jgi:hypothetical protein